MASEDESIRIEANPVELSAIMRASEKYLIVASEAILDVRGFKLWAKGKPVSAGLQERLLERKLQPPLEACLTAQQGATLSHLHGALIEFLASPTAHSGGSLGASAADLSIGEWFEVDIAEREFNHRICELQRWCLLLAMRLPRKEGGLLAPLWTKLQVDDA